MRLNRAARVLIVGAPGVGKGTQTERLLKRFPQLQAISTGDLLRTNVKKRTPLGIQVESIMKSGGLVADNLMLRLISNELQHRGWLCGHRPNVMTLSSMAADAYDSGDSLYTDAFAQAGTGMGPPPQASEEPAASFILDGYPRNAAQALSLDSIVPINLAVAIKTPFDVILERIAGRWVHEPSGRVYNTTFNKPKVAGIDDITGEKLVQRPDDNEKVYRARFQNFQETSEPLLEHYAKKGVLIEVEGMSSDEITPKLYQEFENQFVG
ncbi:hypothetical protein LLEC1_05003 [Akanthomyces lecanii]|uniref:GTP:AMP phosphotransferase, mitochondrial n=1 Tax=Cordyceps confragosa TaxID=2714763 RepID=A0A179IIB4_CORDF|nr:hypothetical protein LLEC1_05003 [Akanthomyces lecanii]